MSKTRAELIASVKAMQGKITNKGKTPEGRFSSDEFNDRTELLVLTAEGGVQNLAGSASDEQTVVKAGNDSTNPASVTITKNGASIHGRAGDVTIDDDGVNISAGNSGFPNATVKVNGQTVATQQYVNNAAAALSENIRLEDGEDLTVHVTDGGKKELKLADKSYAPAVFSGLGRKYLRKNYSVQDAVPFNGFVEGVTVETAGTVLTPTAIFFDTVNKWFVGQIGLKYYNAWQGNGDYEPVSETKTYVYNGKGYTWDGEELVEGAAVSNVLTQQMVSQANTIYVIQYDYDLNGQTITLPAGCVLEFDGGSIKNGTLNGTFSINAQNEKIFDNVKFSGNCIYNEYKIDWFVANYAADRAMTEPDATQEVQQMFDSGIKKVYLTNSHNYKLTDTILVDSRIVIDGAYQNIFDRRVPRYFFSDIDKPLFKIVATSTSIVSQTSVNIRNLYLFRITTGISAANEYKRDISTLYIDCSAGNLWGINVNAFFSQTRMSTTLYAEDNTEITKNLGGYRAYELYTANGRWATFMNFGGNIEDYYECIKIHKDESSSWATDLTISFNSQSVFGGVLPLSTNISGSHQSLKALKRNDNAYFEVDGIANLIDAKIWDTQFFGNMSDSALNSVYCSVKASKFASNGQQSDLISDNFDTIFNNNQYSLQGKGLLGSDQLAPVFFKKPFVGYVDYIKGITANAQQNGSAGVKGVTYNAVVVKGADDTEEDVSAIYKTDESDTNSYVEKPFTKASTYGFEDLFFPDKYYRDVITGDPNSLNLARKSYYIGRATKAVHLTATLSWSAYSVLVINTCSSTIARILVTIDGGAVRDYAPSHTLYQRPLYIPVTTNAGNGVVDVKIIYSDAQQQRDVPFIGLCTNGAGNLVGSWGGSVAGPLIANHVVLSENDNVLSVQRMKLIGDDLLLKTITIGAAVKTFLTIKTAGASRTIFVKFRTKMGSHQLYIYGSSCILSGDPLDKRASFKVYKGSGNVYTIRAASMYEAIIDELYSNGIAKISVDDVYDSTFTELTFLNSAGSVPCGTTSVRPVGLDGNYSLCFFDTTLGKPIWWNGTEWVDATGTAV